MILITGSAGFIGFNLAKHYLEKKIKVVGVDNFSSYYNISYKKQRINILRKIQKFFVS